MSAENQSQIIIAAIRELEEQYQKAKGENIKANQERNQKIEELRELIKQGKETGRGRIEDFITLRYYCLESEKIAAIYHEINRQLEQCVGQFILVITRTEQSFTHYVMPAFDQERETFTKESYILGMIKGSGLLLDLTNNRCGLPIDDDYIIFDDTRLMEMKLIKSKQDLHGESGIFDFFPSSTYLNPKNLELDPTQAISCSLEFKIGDKKVEEWSKTQHLDRALFFSKVSRLLGRDIKKLPMVAGLLQERQEIVAKQLEEFVKKRNSLLMQNIDDYALSTTSLKEDLWKVEKQIIEQLKIANELNMLDAKILLTTIRQMCQDYQIEVS